MDSNKKKALTKHILKALKKQHKALAGLEGVIEILNENIINYDAMSEMLYIIWDIPEDNSPAWTYPIDDTKTYFCHDYWIESCHAYFEGKKKLASVIDDFESWNVK